MRRWKRPSRCSAQRAASVHGQLHNYRMREAYPIVNWPFSKCDNIWWPPQTLRVNSHPANCDPERFGKPDRVHFWVLLIQLARFYVVQIVDGFSENFAFTRLGSARNCVLFKDIASDSSRVNAFGCGELSTESEIVSFPNKNTNKFAATPHDETSQWQNKRKWFETSYFDLQTSSQVLCLDDDDGDDIVGNNNNNNARMFGRLHRMQLHNERNNTFRKCNFLYLRRLCNPHMLFFSQAVRCIELINNIFVFENKLGWRMVCRIFLVVFKFLLCIFR